MIIEILGWIGSVLVIFAYALNINKMLSSDDTKYYLMNIIGSAFLIINTTYHHAIPSAMVNIIWVLIAIIALVKKKKTATN